MSAPYIIPFNFQPVSTNTAFSTYTIPAGKYARVVIKGLILPIVNGNSLCTAKTMPNDTINTPVQRLNFHPQDNVHRVSITKDGTGSTLHVTLSDNGAFVTSTSSHFNLIGSGASASVTFSSPTSVPGAFGLTSAGSISTTSVIYTSYDGPDFIWLKAGDILTCTSGTIFYEEFNVIS